MAINTWAFLDDDYKFIDTGATATAGLDETATGDEAVKPDSLDQPGQRGGPELAYQGQARLRAMPSSQDHHPLDFLEIIGLKNWLVRIFQGSDEQIGYGVKAEKSQDKEGRPDQPPPQFGPFVPESQDTAQDHEDERQEHGCGGGVCYLLNQKD